MTATIENTTHEPQLPELIIEVRGEVTNDNSVEFLNAIRAWMSGINTDLKTDDDFVAAEGVAKVLSEKEKLLIAAEEKAIADAEQVSALLKALRGGGEEIRQTRLTLERQIKAKKEEIRDGIIASAVAEIINGHGEKFRAEIVNAVKGKRNLLSMREAVGVIVTSANALINDNRQLLAAHFEAHGGDLIPDRKALELTATVAQLETELNARIERQKANEARRKAEADAAAARAELEAQKRKAEAAERTASVAAFAEVLPKANGATGDVIAEVAKGYAAKDASLPSPAPAVTPEWDEWLATARAAFTPLKAARERLTNASNKAKAQAFADAVAAAWKEMVS